jgi:hypothetical protein
MEIRVLYYIQYQLPVGVNWAYIEKYCDDRNITVERTGRNRIGKFYGSNEHNLWMVQYHNNLINVK